MEYQKTSKILILFSGLTLFWAPLSGKTQESAKIHGMGTAGRAVLSHNDSLYLNPAIGAAIPLYSVNASLYSFEDASEYTLSAVDGTSKLFAAGVGWSKLREKTRWDGSFAHHFENNAGIGAKVAHFTKSTEEEQLTTLGLGAYYPVQIFPNIINTLHLGVSVDNAVGDSSRVHKSVTPALSFTLFEKLLLAFETSFPLDDKVNSNSFRGGIEVDAISGFFLRGGYRNEEYENFKGPTYGIGWKGPKVAFDYASQKRENLTTQKEETFSIGTITIFFN